MSESDLKPSGVAFSKFACDLGFAGYVFLGFVAFRRQTVVTELYIVKNDICDIGTEILTLQCLNCSQNQFCKSIIPEEIKSSGPPPLDFSDKTRFKAFWDICFEKMYATLASQVTDFAQEGDLT